MKTMTSQQASAYQNEVDELKIEGDNEAEVLTTPSYYAKTATITNGTTALAMQKLHS